MTSHFFFKEKSESLRFLKKKYGHTKKLGLCPYSIWRILYRVEVGEHRHLS